MGILLFVYYWSFNLNLIFKSYILNLKFISVNGTGPFILKLDESFVPVKTIFGFTWFGSNHLSCFSRDLTIKQHFSPAYGKWVFVYW